MKFLPYRRAQGIYDAAPRNTLSVSVVVRRAEQVERKLYCFRCGVERQDCLVDKKDKSTKLHYVKIIIKFKNTKAIRSGTRQH